MSEYLVKIDTLGVSFNGLSVLKNVCCQLKTGKINALVGPNGAGKTTLINVLLGFTSHTGTLEYSTKTKPRIGFVPQRPQVDASSPLTVSDFLSAGITNFPLWLGGSKKLASTIEKSLTDVGISKLINHPLGELSGGELQRVLLANALLQKPDFLLLDEPETGIDIVGSKMFCTLIDDVHNKHELTTLIVSHDLGVIADHADWVIGLRGQVYFEGTVDEAMTEENMIKVFGPHVFVTKSPHQHDPHKLTGDEQ